MMGQPHVYVGGPIDYRSVVVAVGAVDIRRQTPRGCGIDRVLKLCGRGARDQIEQTLVVLVV